MKCNKCNNYLLKLRYYEFDEEEYKDFIICETCRVGYTLQFRRNTTPDLYILPITIIDQTK